MSLRASHQREREREPRAISKSELELKLDLELVLYRSANSFGPLSTVAEVENKPEHAASAP
jgi:hypothetical protein